MDEAAAEDPGAARVAALRLITRRDFSSAELRTRLREQGFADGTVTVLIEELSAERLLDDERYASQYVRSHAERGQGPRRLRQDLAAVGLPDALIAAALEAAPDFHAIARELRARRFGPEPPRDFAERSRQGRFLQYRGFSPDHIRSALGGSGAPEDFPDDEGS